MAKGEWGDEGVMKSISKMAEKVPNAKPFSVVDETNPNDGRTPALPGALKDATAGKLNNNASWIISNVFSAKPLDPLNSCGTPINTNWKCIVIDCKVTKLGIEACIFLRS